MEDGVSDSNNGSTLPSYSNSVRTATAAQAYKRVRRVVGLHWRGIVIVLLIIANVVFFSVIFVYYDSMTQRPIREIQGGDKWLLCLILNQGNKNKCLDLAEHVALNLATVMAVLIIQSVSFWHHPFPSSGVAQKLNLSNLQINGIWCILLLGRWSMIPGWTDLFKRKFTSQEEFVSIDARRFSSNNPKSYEMLKSPPQPEIQSPEPAMTPDPYRSPNPAVAAASPLPFSSSSPPSGASPITTTAAAAAAAAAAAVAADTVSPSSSTTGKGSFDYFAAEAKYASPNFSFSTPRPPACSPPRRDEWDPTTTYAPSMRLSTTSSSASSSRRSREKEPPVYKYDG